MLWYGRPWTVDTPGRHVQSQASPGLTQQLCKYKSGVTLVLMSNHDRSTVNKGTGDRMKNVRPYVLIVGRPRTRNMILRSYDSVSQQLLRAHSATLSQAVGVTANISTSTFSPLAGQQIEDHKADSLQRTRPDSQLRLQRPDLAGKAPALEPTSATKFDITHCDIRSQVRRTRPSSSRKLAPSAKDDHIPASLQAAR